jgi:hypothetical protein
VQYVSEPHTCTPGRRPQDENIHLFQLRECATVFLCGEITASVAEIKDSDISIGGMLFCLMISYLFAFESGQILF